jgi:hypothetical protein
VARLGLLHRRRAATSDVEDTQDLADTRNERIVSDYDRTLTDTWPGRADTWPGRTWPAVEPAEHRWVRVGAWAILGLIVSVVAVCVTMTGLLAPEGLVLGVIGVLVSIRGIVGASRPGITGHSLAILGVLAGIAAAGLGWAAMTGHLSWLSSRTDEVARWHTWLVAHFPWLDHW